VNLIQELKVGKLVLMQLGKNQVILGLPTSLHLPKLTSFLSVEPGVLALCWNNVQINRLFKDLPEPAWDLVDIFDQELLINLNINQTTLPKEWIGVNRANLISVQPESFSQFPKQLNMPLVGFFLGTNNLPDALNPQDIIVTLRPAKNENKYKIIRLEEDGSVSVN